MKYLPIILLFIVAACKTQVETREVYIRDTTYVAKPPVIIDSGKAQVVTDTVVRYIEVKDRDTITDIRYLPGRTEFKWKIQPDTVRITARDTLVNTKVEYRVVETPFMSKVGLVALGIFLALAGLSAWYFTRNRRG